MKENVPGLNKIIYFSDGASAQYKKKKNFLNICLHEEDFGVSAEWNFFVTSHGKGPCDGIEEALKRNANETAALKARFEKAKVVRGTLTFHCIRSITQKKMLAKRYSNAESSVEALSLSRPFLSKR